MIIEVERYITNNYYKLLVICKKYTKNEDWASELLHEIILQLYEKKQMNIKLDDESIKSYIIRCIMVNWVYPSSPFYRKYKKNELNQIELNDAVQMIKDDSQIEHHRFMDIMEEEFADVNWFNKLIFEKYLTFGSLKRVSVDTTITLPSIGRYIKETKQQVKLNTFKRFNNE